MLNDNRIINLQHVGGVTPQERESSERVGLFPGLIESPTIRTRDDHRIIDVGKIIMKDICNIRASSEVAKNYQLSLDLLKLYF